MNAGIDKFMEELKSRTPGENEFHQAVREVIETVWDVYDANQDTNRPKYWSAWLNLSGPSCSAYPG